MPVSPSVGAILSLELAPNSRRSYADRLQVATRWSSMCEEIRRAEKPEANSDDSFIELPSEDSASRKAYLRLAGFSLYRAALSRVLRAS